MQNRRLIFILLMVAGVSLERSQALGQDDPPNPSAVEIDSEPDTDLGSHGEAPPADVPTPQAPKARKGTRERKAEGTEALNRFEAETVLKSRYRDASGRRYDVDPD